MVNSSTAAMTAPARRFPGYNAVWRWHFYAGLFCIPFVVLLALTGSIYLFKPQIEALIDQPYATVASAGTRADAAAIAAAAVRAVPGGALRTYQLPESPRQAVQVLVAKGTTETRVYVNPETLAVVNAVDEDSRPMEVIFRLHGELLSGTPGSYVVELAASWAIVMIISGLYLWWPRTGGWAGVLFPRLGARGRVFWRDLHAVTGFWISLFALGLLVSGLPWAKSWGGYLKAVRGVVEGPVGKPDWSTGTADKLAARAAMTSATGGGGEHAGHGGMAMPMPALMSYAPLTRVVATTIPLDLAPPVLISPPKTAGGPWSAKSDAGNRPLRVDLKIDGDTGAIVSRKDFAGRKPLDRILGYGIAAHEGQLFGLANQLFNLVIAAGLVLLAVSSVVLWWRRRPADALGAPVALARPPVAWGFVAILVGLGLFLPLLAASMLLVLLAEQLVLRHLQGPRRWLGLA